MGAVAIAVAYLPVVHAVLTLGRGDPYYGYLGLVLPVFAVMLWASRDRRATVAGRGHRLGVALVLLAFLLLALGRWESSLQLQSLSLVVAVAGAGVWLRGVDWVRATAFPLAFLLFLVPVPRGLFDAVTLDVQRFVARHAGAMLQSFGVPVRLEEIAIHLPGVTLEIVEGCNGLRFLMGLVVLMAGTAGLLVSSATGRALLVALAVPAALAANVVRITALGLAAYWFGPDAAQGGPHDIIGKTVWAATILSLVLVAWRLGRRRDTAPALGQHARVASR